MSGVDALAALEAMRASFARWGATEALDALERQNDGAPILPVAIANVPTPQPKTPAPPVTNAPESTTARPTTKGVEMNVDASAGHVEPAPAVRRIHGWSTRPEVAARVARYHRVQAGRDR